MPGLAGLDLSNICWPLCLIPKGITHSTPDRPFIIGEAQATLKSNYYFIIVKNIFNCIYFLLEQHPCNRSIYVQ